MEIYEIWIEGFNVEGVLGPATFHGYFKAHTFDGAVQRWASTLSPLSQDLISHNDGNCWTISTSRIFSNEEDARASFG